MNRPEAEEEESLQERSSEPLGLESCAATVRDPDRVAGPHFWGPAL